MKKIHLLYITYILMLTSCNVYQKTAVSLSKAVDIGEVQTTNQAGEILILESIAKSDGNYYGSRNGVEFLIDSTTQNKFYPKLIKVDGYRIKLKPINESVKQRGILTAVNDSIITIIPANKRFLVSALAAPINIRISDISKISQSTQKAAVTGGVIGFGFGFAVGAMGANFMSGYMGTAKTPTSETIGTGMATGAIFGTLGALLSSAIGNKSYHLNHDLPNYKSKDLSKLKAKIKD